MNAQPLITLSIVSHNQLDLIERLLNTLVKHNVTNIEVILTLNTGEQIPAHFQQFNLPIKYIKNVVPQGFGRNHNIAFFSANTPYFCVLNPDIRLTMDPFGKLLETMTSQNVGCITPAIFDKNNLRQDNARFFPTISRLLKRILSKEKSLDYSTDTSIVFPDWIAGMFMLFREKNYRMVGGFDEAFYLYCEDIDICAKLQQYNVRICVDNTVRVIHDAQRDSHRKIKYLYWHLQSMLRFLFRYYTGYYKNK